MRQVKNRLIIPWARVGIAIAGMLALAVSSVLPSTADAAGTWKYTALGDSIGAGLWAPPGSGYVPVYAAHLKAGTGEAVEFTNLSVPRWKSSDLLHALKTDSGMRASVAASTVVTWEIGGNDMIAARSRYKDGSCGGADGQDCLRDALAAFKENWTGIVSEVKALRHGQQTIYRTFSIYNPFVDEDRADGSFQVLKPYIDQGNVIICSLAAQAAGGYRCANVYSRFNGQLHVVDPARFGLLARDDLHPNSTGHAEIAAALKNLGFSPLR